VAIDINSYKALILGEVKGTISRFTSKGASDREKVLDTDKINLVNFLSIAQYLTKHLSMVAGGTFVTTSQLG
jgi:hypothetical protein